MDIDNENKMEEALAELLEVDVDIIDILNLDIQMDIGNDDFLYGYYVEFPEKQSIDKDILSQIDQTDINKIPWGRTEYYSESQFGNTDADPFGWKAEWEAEEYYQSQLPSKENILKKLQDIESKIYKYSDDELIVKSLIFSAFSITESYTYSLVWNQIPNFDFSELNNNLKTILKKDLIHKLTKNETRIKLYNDLTGKKLKPIPYFSEIRNSLAHNMFSAEIIDNKIIIKDKDDNEQTYLIETIIDALKSFINEPTI